MEISKFSFLSVSRSSFSYPSVRVSAVQHHHHKETIRVEQSRAVEEGGEAPYGGYSGGLFPFLLLLLFG